MTLSLAQEHDLLRSVELALIDPQSTPEYRDGIRAGLEIGAQHLEARARQARIWLRPRRKLRELAASLRSVRIA